MVGLAVIYSVALFLLPINLFAVTADELRALSSDANREQQASETRVKTSDKGSLLKSDDQGANNSTDTGTRIFSKQRDDDPLPAKKKKKTTAPATTNNSDTNSSTAAGAPGPSGEIIVSDAVSTEMSFGIRLGTWIEGNINRNTSSAELGLVEITLTEDVVGTKRTLKSGTLLFAQKQMNTATRRLELLAVKGITPTGKEFKVTGLIFDTLRVSGLAGIVSSDTNKTVSRGMGKGLLAGAGSVAQTLAGANPVGSAAGAAANSMLSDQNNVVEQTTEQQLTIYVSPQPVLIRIDQTF
jgi:hypothetical protein